MYPVGPIHQFHIPVMGTSYTIDTPIRVAHYGITSVMSLIDHRLIEQIREMHCQNFGFEFVPIDESEHDCKARRVTAYLNLVADIVDLRFNALKNTPFEEGTEITKYFEMLNEQSALKQQYYSMLKLSGDERKVAEDALRQQMRPGSIDGNIMTKVDSVSYTKDGTALSTEFNDAHASLRGFAQSKLSSSLVFSAGMNPRLYGYIAQFADFFPNPQGVLNKQIILKVSDYRSALIQGKFLAKKGLWVSEFRVESGLNCGGHAFASDGYLLGPIMQEFHNQRQELAEELFDALSAGLRNAQKEIPSQIPQQRLTVQGGVGTWEEQSFLFHKYNVDSVGWGTPFLLVPEAVSIDQETIEILEKATEKDLYLSKISPLGVPFNSVRGNTAEVELLNRIAIGKPGAACLKKHLVSTPAYTSKPICTASIQYQKHKLGEMQEEMGAEAPLSREYDDVTQKTCLCVGLGNAALKAYSLKTYRGSQGVAVCPGPNMAYYDHVVSLREMVDHIYGRTNIMSRTDRPNMFIKELSLYVDYLRNKVLDCAGEISDSQRKYFDTFRSNLIDGINYYREMFPTIPQSFKQNIPLMLAELQRYHEELESIFSERESVVMSV